MENKRIVESEQVERGYAIASIISSIPNIVWVSLVASIGAIVVLASFFHHNQIESFINNLLTWGLYIIIAIGACICLWGAYKTYKAYHTIRMDIYAQRTAKASAKKSELLAEKADLQNKQLRVKIALEEQLPAVIKYALESGHNIEYSKDGLKVHNLSNVHALTSGPNGTAMGQAQIASPIVDMIPEPYTMSSVLENWEPSKDGILLAAKDGLITVPPGEDMCHTVFTGNTDSGKTNDERMLLIQLLYVGEQVWLCDRNYSPLRYDTKTGDTYDYRPIESQLMHPAIDNAVMCNDLLKYQLEELDDRRARRRKSGNAGYIIKFDNTYIFIDELPAFAQEEPLIMARVGRIVREARQYGIFFVGAAQDLLNSTVNADAGAYKDNMLTNYYGGGDMNTARKVLNLKKGEVLQENGLGKKGLKYLRAKGANLEHTLVRTAYADDNATQLLLSDMKPRIQVDSIGIHPSKVEETPGETPGLSGELLTVYNACMELDKLDSQVSARNVEDLTGIKKDKANLLIGRLEDSGYIGRRVARKAV